MKFEHTRPASEYVTALFCALVIVSFLKIWFTTF